MNIIGIAKTKFHSSVCLIPNENIQDVQIWQTERLTRKKDSGAWPSAALEHMELWKNQNNIFQTIIAENRDVETPAFFESFYNEQFPFFDYLSKTKLEKYSSHFNPSVQFVSHHKAHAYAALATSPFAKSLIVVMDGGGSRSEDLESNNSYKAENDHLEECSVYTQDDGRLKLVFKRFIRLLKEQARPGVIADGPGPLFEKISEHIFNSPTSAGKVMGLAPFGKAYEIQDLVEFQQNLDWKKQFAGKSKQEWESSDHLEHYKNLAATVQNEFERNYKELLTSLHHQFPQYENLILTGGCALNCTNNAKILNLGLFKNIYVPPFPGDECIGLGTAAAVLYENAPEKWKPIDFKNQTAYWGPLSSIPVVEDIAALLKTRKIHFKICNDVLEDAVADLLDGKIIGWFQGRSESGPRALGNRSILARPDRAGIKNELNDRIKQRESFRPYGCTVIHEKASEYFEVEKNFENPFMTFAVKVKENFSKILFEVSHIDGTSRMQTLHRDQNQLYYDLINRFGDTSGIYCLLNTSLNVMGEPIVESAEDALRFFEKTPVDSMYIGAIKLSRIND